MSVTLNFAGPRISFTAVKRLVLILLICAAALVLPAAAANAEMNFQTTTLEPAGNIVEDVAVGDVDGRNGPDIVTAYAEGGISVQLNDGHGHFGAPQMYATGCDVKQIELADVGAPPSSIFPDGHLDAVISCSFNGGETIELGRMFGDGSGGFSAPVMFPESDYGSFNGLALSHQAFALVEYRGATGPPVPVWTRLVQPESFHFHRYLCLSYDWSTVQCVEGEGPQPYAPLVAGRVAEAELFSYGGALPEALLDWGPNGVWHASTRDFGPEPASREPADIWRSITIGDLQGDGPDILTSAGTSGAVLEEAASGRVSVLYGNTAEGVPPQHATTFPSELGVEGIATGDFDLDGHTDVVGSDWHYSAATGAVGGVFFQSGDGAGHLGAPQEIPLYTGERYNYDPVRVADLDANGTPDVVADRRRRGSRSAEPEDSAAGHPGPHGNPADESGGQRPVRYQEAAEAGEPAHLRGPAARDGDQPTDGKCQPDHHDPAQREGQRKRLHGQGEEADRDRQSSYQGPRGQDRTAEAEALHRRPKAAEERRAARQAHDRRRLQRRRQADEVRGTDDQAAQEEEER